MNLIENVFDAGAAALLLGGAGATYGDAARIKAWGVAMGCTVFEIIRDAGTDTLVLVACNAETVFVCFRGTQDLRNWITDVDVRRVPAPVPSMGGGPSTGSGRAEIHAGFHAAFGSVRGGLRESLTRLVPGRQNVMFAGHSLGGDLAMEAMAWWSYGVGPPDVPGWLMTFGQARLGNAAFARWYDARLRARTWRVVHSADIVPRVPWLLGGFRHAGIEIFFDALGRVHRDFPAWRKLPSDALALYWEWKKGKVALLADHHWLTYRAVLEGAARRESRPTAAQPAPVA